ncbi:MAG: radical SAM protein, partial [Desulfuromonadales bacterium]|nr:radical SAM protein [Desulfuromonadales bacterium]
MAKGKTILAVVADESGEVFEHPDLLLAGISGTEAVRPRIDELIPMPEGSRLFTIPQTPPIGFDRRSGKQITADRLPKQWGGGSIQAVSA